MRPLAKQILTYLALVFTFSSLPVYLMVHSGHVGAGDGLVAGLMVWCPAFAALTTCLSFFGLIWQPWDATGGRQNIKRGLTSSR